MTGLALCALAALSFLNVIFTYIIAEMKCFLPLSQRQNLYVYFRFIHSIILSTFHAGSLHIILYTSFLLFLHHFYFSFVFSVFARRATVGGRQVCRRKTMCRNMSLDTEFESFIFEFELLNLDNCIKKTEFKSHNLNLHCLT